MKLENHSSRFIEMFGNPISPEQNYPLKKLGECVEINPHRDAIPLADSELVSFVPMPSVNEEGYLQDVADVEFGSVKKGFTYFKNGDILFAKITPCMENGKGAIAERLTNGIGMGSTEFHVLRPIPGVSLGYWILALTRLPIFREKAAKNMTGTGGQKRVPSSFLSEFKVGLPPISAQNKFAMVHKQADKSKFNGFKSRFISQFERPEYLVYSFDEICYDDTKSATKIPASEYSKQGLYPIFDQATDSVIAGYTNDSNGINNDYPAVLFGDHSRVVKLIDRAFFIGADGVKVLRPVNAGLSTEFLYYQIKYKKIPNTGYNRHFKYLKDHSYCVPSKNEQDAFLAMCHQADKSKYLS